MKKWNSMFQFKNVFLENTSFKTFLLSILITGISYGLYKGMSDNDYGSVSAKSVLLFVILTIMCVSQYVATKKAEDACLG